MPDLNIRAAADKAIADMMPVGKRVAVVTAVITEGGQTRAQFGFAFKVDDHWQVTDTLTAGQGSGLVNSFYIVGSW